MYHWVLSLSSHPETMLFWVSFLECSSVEDGSFQIVLLGASYTPTTAPRKSPKAGSPRTQWVSHPLLVLGIKSVPWETGRGGSLLRSRGWELGSASPHESVGASPGSAMFSWGQECLLLPLFLVSGYSWWVPSTLG